MRRQRTVRIGNVRVASATVARISPRFACRTPSTRSRALTPCSAHARRPRVTPSPTSHAQREAATRLGASGAVGIRLEGERNEVADFFDEGAQGVAGGLLRRGAQLLGTRQRAVAAIQQAPDGEDGRLRGGGGRGGGARGRGRPGPPPPPAARPGTQRPFRRPSTAGTRSTSPPGRPS